MIEKERPPTPQAVATAVATKEATPTQQRPVRLSTFSSLRHLDFRLLWISVAFSSAGQWMEQVALSWLVYDLTNDPLTLGLVNGAKAVPALLSGPFGGVAADRMARKRLMLVSQFCIMLLALGLALLIFSKTLQVWHLYAFAVLTGLAWSFNQPVRQSLVPSLVPREDLTNAIALQSAAFQLTRLVGPALAGFIIVWFGVGGAFLAKGLVYIGVIAMILAMKIPPLPEQVAKESVWTTLAGGFSYIKRDRPILSLILLALIPQLFAMPYFTLLPVFAKDVLGVGPEGFGILVTLPGVGAVAATLTIASIGDFPRKGRVLIVAGIAFGMGILALAATSLLPSSSLALGSLSIGYVAASVCLAAMGGCMMSYNTLTNTLLQMLSRDDMRGRVMSVYMLDQGITPLGTMWAGFLASVPSLGAPGAFAIMGITVIVLSTTAALKFPHLRKI